ncbi:meiosis initiator protein isoform X1 [Manis javanica]|uniref:meiosis initiator protein isoform X1 n=1 Tax=Manis javanica TaxID=9974 RepID=UPI003C6CDE5B
MWSSSIHVCSPEVPRASSLGPSDGRRQRKNHTGKLQELALLLPVAPKIGPKKLTKKEILLHILHYIQHLQRSADVTKALLRRHISSGDGGLGGCCGKRSAQDVGTYHAFQVQQGPERIRFLNRTQTCSRQNLVFYDSSEEADKESRNSDPWLPAWIPEGSPHGSPLALEPPQISNWSVTGHPSEILGFSPTLFSSPGKLLSEQILEDGTECLTQALFEEVFSDPALSPSACMPEAPRKKETFPEAPRDPPDFHSLCQPSVSLDNFYLSLDKNIVTQSSFEDPDTELVWNQQENAPANPQGLQSSSAEDRDYTWTTTQRISALSTAGRKARKGQGGRGPMKLKENMRAPCPTQRKKKCVNGFIMFCRMNRKQYIRASPGTPSTDATKELAQLWRGMTVQERRPYCIKARRFSLRHNRIVRQDSSSSEDEDWETPKPFYQLLAEKARRSPNVSSRLPPHQD